MPSASNVITAIAAKIVNFEFGGCDGFQDRPVNAQGGDETCVLVPQPDGTVAIHSPNGQQWLSVQMDGSLEGRPTSDPSQPGPWEKFTRAGNVLTEVVKEGISRSPVQFLFREDGVVAIPPSPSSAPTRLHRDGTHFRNADGQLVFLRGASFFAGYWLYLEKGADAIRPSLQELQGLGCNLIRVFGMSFYVQQNLFGTGPFNPSTYGDRYFDALPDFLALAAEYGMYVYFSVFPDNDLIPPYHNNSGVEQTHWNRLLDTLRPCPNLLIEVSNEPDAHGFNYIDPYTLTFPDFCPSCPGSYGEDSDAYASGTFPHGSDWGGDRSFGDIHPRRSYPAEIMDSMAVNNVYYLHNRPLMIGEPDRFGSNGNGNVEQAKLTGASGAVGGVGIVFHSLQGEKCEVFDPQTRACAEAFFHALSATR